VDEDINEVLHWVRGAGADGRVSDGSEPRYDYDVERAEGVNVL